MTKGTRAFFGVFIPQVYQNLIWDTLKPYRDSIPAGLVRWTNPEDFHITLQFLQSLKTEDIPSIVQLIESKITDFKAFELDLGPMEWFPEKHDRGILTLSVLSQETLRHLSELTAQILDAFKYPLESRTFKAHVTVGRVKTYHQVLERIPTISLPDFPPIVINDFYLVESKPGKNGSQYSSLVQFKLARN